MTAPWLTSALADADDTSVVVMGTDVLDQTGTAFREAFGPKATAIVVADDNTWAVAGAPVTAALQAAGVSLDEPYIFAADPILFADDQAVETLRQHLAGTDAVAVAVASGSLNDITKDASGKLKRPYLVVCTAASVDGYTSFGAAITVAGVKQTVNCPAPKAVVVPIDVMAKAPRRMTATGLGDLIEKVPAGADWILADAVGTEPINQYVFELVQSPLAAAIAHPDALTRGDIAAVTDLAKGLVMSGIAMQVHKDSRPASGAGHYFSHQWEMEGYGRDWDPPLSHGFKVGLGTVAMCALYEQVLLIDLTDFDIEARLASWPTAAQDEARVRALQPDPVICEAAVKQSAGKYLTADQARARLEVLVARWPSLRERIAAQVLPVTTVEDILRRVGAIYHPAQIGVSMEELRRKYFQAQTLRSRYTVLDTLQELGMLESIVDGLFATDGYWGGRPTALAWIDPDA